MLSIFSLSSSGLEALHITASERLRDGERDELLAREDVLGNTLAKLRICEVKNGRQTDDSSSVETVCVSPCAHASKLLCDDEFVEVVELQSLCQR